MNLAVILARGGSKRIPRKNIRLFAGRPIIEYSIEAALNADSINRVIVSTDDDEIAEISIAAGAEVPFRRPAELADDLTGLIGPMRHAIDWALKTQGGISYACCLFPTAPFLSADLLGKCLNELKASPDADFSFPVTTFPSSIFRAFSVSDDGSTRMFWPEYERSRTQDLPEAFHDSGMFYWGTAEAFQTKDRFFTSNSLAIRIARFLVHDLDTHEDWERAELVYQSFRHSGRDPLHASDESA